ncbi:MAG: SDR family NAD(P)-dependent oxidoreductase [Rhizomicrobium sp.]
MNILSGKTALVTGASRGMGRAAALELAKAGAQVLVHYSNGAKEADAVVAEIRATGARAETVQADLSQADGAHRLAKQVRDIVGGRLDILVANAGISKNATIEDTTVEDFDRLFAVNVRAPFFLVQQLLPILGPGSSVILLSSLAAHAAVGTLAAYAATKGAIDTLVKHFAAALGGPRHPRQRRRPGRDQHRHVELRAHRRRQGVHPVDAGPAADRRGRRRRGRSWRSWRRTPRAGSPATRCGSTAAPSCEREAKVLPLKGGGGSPRWRRDGGGRVTGTRPPTACLHAVATNRSAPPPEWGEDQACAFTSWRSRVLANLMLGNLSVT